MYLFFSLCLISSALAVGVLGPIEGAVARNMASSLTEPSRQGTSKKALHIQCFFGITQEVMNVMKILMV